MKGFSKVSFAPMTNDAWVNDFPVYGSFIKLYTQTQELNNVSLSISDNTNKTEKKADNITKTTIIKEGYGLTLEVYDYDVDGAVAIFGTEKDTNGNEIMIVNGTKIRGCLFFETISDDDKRIQYYLYDVALSAPAIRATTGFEDKTISIEGTGSYLNISGVQYQGAKVSEGNSGFVSEEPNSVYVKNTTEPVEPPAGEPE